MDKEDIGNRIAILKAEGKKITEHLSEEEFKFFYGFPAPTPERLAAIHAKQAENRARKKIEKERLRAEMAKDYDTKLDELVPLALHVINDCMYDPKPDMRFRAAVEVLNRRFGKPSQELRLDSKKAEEIVYNSTVLDVMKEGETASRN